MKTINQQSELVLFCIDEIDIFYIVYNLYT